MTTKKIKPIPKYIEKLIRKTDKVNYPKADGHTRFYAYFTKNDGELVKVTVAVKNRYKKWHCKQVAVHGIHSDVCFARDMDFYFIAGYVVDWSELDPRYAQWRQNQVWYVVDDKYFDPFAVPVNIHYVLKQPEYKYSAVEQINETNTFKYLRLYEQYPEGEYLIKLGFKDYATSKMLLRKLHKDVGFRKWLIQHKAELLQNKYYITTWLKAYASNKSLAQVQLEIANKKVLKDSNYRDLRELFADDFEQFFIYLSKQQISVSEYNDYYLACRGLGLDMTLPKNRLPHDFKRWHDIRIDEYRTAKALKDAEERKELYAKFASVAEKYLPLQKDNDDAFVMVIARSPQDLIKEGEALNHCVGRMNYDQKFVREESLIFFVRDKQTPDKPFVTVEYSLSQRKILQCYGYHDSKPKDDILNFVNKKWLPYANRKLKKIAA